MQQESNIPQSSSGITPENNEIPYLPPTTPPSSPKKDRRESVKSVLSTLAVIIIAPLIALLLINFVFQSYEVDGESMETTLQNQDRLIVWKVPATLAKIRNQDYIPARGDIIVFTKHGFYEKTGGGDKQLIKRVIGLPGDRVVVSDGTYTIYNKENPEGFNPDELLGYSDSIPYTSGNIDVTVEEGEVFVSGDNRPNSLDSRSFGPIKARDIVGKLEFRIFPFNKFESY